MNSSINQVDSSVYNAFGFGIPFPQFMPYQMAHQQFPTICNGIYAHMPIYVAPNMNQGMHHNGMNYASNIQTTMMHPMKYPYPSPILSPHCSPNGQISLNANVYSIVPSFQNGCGIWPPLFNLPSRFQEAQLMTPISPYESTMNSGEQCQPVATETQFHTIVPMETLIPPARRSVFIQKANKRKMDENDAVTPTKKLKNGLNAESFIDEELVLPAPLRDSNRCTEVNPVIMPMPPPAPGTLFAGSMACNRHPDDISAISSPVHFRRATSVNFNPISWRSSQKVKQQRILASIRKRNEYIYSSNLMDHVLRSGSSIENSIALNGMIPSISQAARDDNSPARLASQHKGDRNGPSPIRNPACFLPRSLVLPGSSDENMQDEERFAP